MESSTFPWKLPLLPRFHESFHSFHASIEASIPSIKASMEAMEASVLVVEDIWKLPRPLRKLQQACTKYADSADGPQSLVIYKLAQRKTCPLLYVARVHFLAQIFLTCARLLNQDLNHLGGTQFVPATGSVCVRDTSSGFTHIVYKDIWLNGERHVSSQVTCPRKTVEYTFEPGVPFVRLKFCIQRSS